MKLDKVLINRILLVFVVAIWVLIFYKFFIKKSAALVVNNFNSYEVRGSMIPEKNNDTSFEIKPLKFDPFLGKIREEKKEIIVSKKRSKEKKISNFVWPNIKYLGLIKKTNQAGLALLKINGRIKKIRRGKKEKEFGFIVSKIYKDSILLINGRNKKIIKTKK